MVIIKGFTTILMLKASISDAVVYSCLCFLADLTMEENNIKSGFRKRAYSLKPSRKGCASFLRTNALTIATFLGVIAGVILGVILRASKEDDWSKREAMYVSFVGKLFLSALKSIIIPLVIPSLIIAIGTLDISLSGKIGGRAVAYYMSTTLVRIDG